MDDQWFVLELNPEPWAIGPVGVARKNGKMIPYVGRNQQLDAYKEAVKEALGPVEMLTGKVDITFFFWRVRSEYSTPQARTHRKHEADATNMQKATEDALQDLLYKNDKDNVHVESYVVEQGPDVTPRVVIRVREAGPFNPDLIPLHVWNQIEDTDSLDGGPSDNVWRGPDAF